MVGRRGRGAQHIARVGAIDGDRPRNLEISQAAARERGVKLRFLVANARKQGEIEKNVGAIIGAG